MKSTISIKPLHISITTSTIIKMMAILLLLYLGFLVKEVLTLMFVLLMFASVFD